MLHHNFSFVLRGVAFLIVTAACSHPAEGQAWTWDAGALTDLWSLHDNWAAPGTLGDDRLLCLTLSAPQRKITVDRSLCHFLANKAPGAWRRKLLLIDTAPLAVATVAFLIAAS